MDFPVSMLPMTKSPSTTEGDFTPKKLLQEARLTPARTVKAIYFMLFIFNTIYSIYRVMFRPIVSDLAIGYALLSIPGVGRL